MSERILRAKEAMQRLGVMRTAFFENFILTGRLRKVRLTPRRAVGFLESEVNQVIAELAADRLPPRHEPQPVPASRGRYKGASDTAA